MLATFVIGLREGLEAALIVSIVAAFLRRNGQSLKAMWTGVVAAVLLSIAVGVGLKIVEASLPQAAQEGMETVIGGVAILFVTGMVLWMRTNARFMKKELESAATEALSEGSARALAVMAFLAVLKEGFETAVFLLATLQSSVSGTAAAGGAVLGLCAAFALGVGIYSGGVRINLAKFFSFTSVFLVLVAAGLVATALGTAHEAGWLNIGQGKTFDLGWVSPDGSIRSALLTGVFGIPREPRVIQVIGWLAYILMIGWMLYAPAELRPSPRTQLPLLRFFSGVAVVTAVLLSVMFGRVSETPSPRASLQAASGALTLKGVELAAPSGVIHLHQVAHENHAGVPTTVWAGSDGSGAAELPGTVTLIQLEALNGGSLPVGVNPATTAGPFTAQWAGSSDVRVWTYDGGLVDAHATGPTALTVSGGGLATERTIAVTSLNGLGITDARTSWQMANVSHAASIAKKHEKALQRRSTWGRNFPILLLIAAGLMLWRSFRIKNHLEVDASGEKTPHAGASLLTENSQTSDDRPQSRTSENQGTHSVYKDESDHLKKGSVTNAR